MDDLDFCALPCYCVALLILVMLGKVVPDKVQEIKGMIEMKHEEIITYRREEKEASVNLESVIQ